LIRNYETEGRVSDIGVFFHYSQNKGRRGKYTYRAMFLFKKMNKKENK